MGYNYKHVVVIVVDGAGTFFKKTPMPRMDEIFANGATTSDCLSAFPTISAQCYGSILHGVTPIKHGLTNSIADTEIYKNHQYPSCFKLVREAMPDATLAAYCNWSPIYRGIIENDLGVLTETGGDYELTPKIVDCIKEHKPELMFIQLDDIDGAGHTHGYGTDIYFKALTEEDSLLGNIWDAVCDAGIADDTLFIVTADHGGAGHGHGGLAETEKYVYFAARGKTVAPVHGFKMYLRDIAAVICHAFGLEKHSSWDSFIPRGMFTDTDEADYRPDIYNNEFNSQNIIPTPKCGDANYIGSIFPAESIAALYHFDGNADNSLGNTNVTGHGKIYYSPGYRGECVGLSSEGYLELDGIDLADSDFAIAMWLKPAKFPSKGSIGESVILTSKKVDSADAGFTAELISYADSDKLAVRFTVTYTSGRVCTAMTALPENARGAFTHLVFMHSRTEGRILISVNFDALELTQNSAAEGEDISLPTKLITLGRDMGGVSSAPLEAELDDLIFLKVSSNGRLPYDPSVFTGCYN